MKLDILTIGDELLIGQTLNTNAFWMAKALNDVGFEIRQQLTISDGEAEILSAVDAALKLTDVILITGGLGPTNDDLTMPVLNKYFGGKLVKNDEIYEHIEQLILSRGYKMNKNNQTQAIVPDNCKPIMNHNGTAPGLWFTKGNKVVVAMPGVPYEMKAMVTDSIIPLLKEKYQLPTILHQMVYTQGIPESMLAEKIEDWENQLPTSIKLAYLPSAGRVKLRLSSVGEEKTVLQENINVELDKLYQLIPEFIYSIEDENIAALISKLLNANQATIATAESCTGGYIAHLITKIAGSSTYFKGSVIAYANEIKVNELGVDTSVIEQYGAVSQQVVEQMAAGVRSKMNTDYAIATSGIAGPSGGSDQKPVGTVWVAVATPNEVIAKKFEFGKQREVNIERSAIAALGMLRNVL